MTDKISPAVQEAVQRVDAQIRHHLGLVQDLKSQRNGLMPISRLPAEILGRIFHEVRARDNGHGRDDVPSFWSWNCFNEPSLKWISISHVSQHWRNVATNDASLWTDPPLKNPKWAMMMLERSRMATIPAITLKVEELDKRVVAALKPHIPRVSSLMIPNMARGTLKQVLSGLPSIAPKLEALSISSSTKVTSGGRSFYYGAIASLYDEALVFPNNVLCHTPKLQHLQLNDIIIKADSSLLTNLTTLSMSGVPKKSKPTPQQFKTMLESAPCLKRLTLMGVCPSTDSIQQKEWMAPVLLQHLEYLHIDETIPQLIYFFGIFSAAHLLKALTVRVKWTEEFAPDLPILFAALDQPYLRSIISSSTDVRRLEVSNNNRAFFIRASKLSVSERNLEPDKRQMSVHSALMTIWINTDSDDREPMADIILSGLFNNFAWTGLSELDIGWLQYASPQILASTFGTILQLRIIIADLDTLSLIKALNHHSGAQSNTSVSTPLSFPGLQHIDLGGTSLIQGEENFEVFVKCLQRRHERGVPIISLKFNHDRLEEQVFSMLKKYVEHIILTPSGGEHKVGDDYSPYNHTWYL